MTVTTATLTRSAGLSAVAGGLLFIAVQIKHPHLDADFVTTTEWTLRESTKIVMAVLSLVGITGIYLRQVKQIGLLGLFGYLIFGAGYLLMLSTQVIAVGVLPTLARSEPGYVNDVLAVASGGHAAGDIGLMQPLSMVSGIAYIGGGVLFGIALLRANVLARWASVLLSVGAAATVGVVLLPQVNYRLFAVPASVALIGLGYSLWRGVPTSAVQSRSTTGTAQLDPAGVK